VPDPVVIASPDVSGAQGTAGRGLLILADGAQAAFTAGAVAELARAGVSWERGAGGGLGAHVALLALLGEAEEAERRWLRDAEAGCPLFQSRLAAAQQRLGRDAGVVVTPDPWTLAGWLEPAALAEHLAPEMAAVPERLARAGRGFTVAVEDLIGGEARWVDFAGLGPEQAGALLRAAATFPGGWGPEPMVGGEVSRWLWGGVGAAPASAPPWGGGRSAWDVVCGFPVPVAVRPALGGSLYELMQRRQEARAAVTVSGWLGQRGDVSLRVLAPTVAAYRGWAARDNADLGVEYPLSWERNGELTGAMVRFGAFVARSLGVSAG
jgi:predicted acylesterase/phospholipase RssA